jgi:hypothetical protein
LSAKKEKQEREKVQLLQDEKNKNIQQEKLRRDKRTSVLWSWSTLIWSESADRTTEKIKKLI